MSHQVPLNTPTKFYEKSSSTNHCRLCIQSSKKFSKIFSYAGKSKQTADRIRRVTGIGIIESDSVSNILCQKCNRFIESVIKFQDDCTANQTKAIPGVRIKRIISSPSSRNVENISPRKRLSYSNASVTTKTVISEYPSVYLKRKTNILKPVSSNLFYTNNPSVNNDQSTFFNKQIPDLFTPPHSPISVGIHPNVSSYRKFITSEAEQKVIKSVRTRIPDEISKSLEDVPNIMNSIKTNICKSVSISCKDLCKQTDGSVLLNNDFDDMIDNNFEMIWKELKNKHPFLLEMLSAVSGCKKDIENVPNELKTKYCFVYSILMNCRWKKLSLLQRINTVLMIEGGGSKMVSAIFY